MTTRIRPSIARSLRRWQMAEAQVRASRPDSAEHEEAFLCASDAQWRYLDLLRHSKGRLGSVSRQILDTTRELRATELQRAGLRSGSPDERAAARDVRALSANLVDLATEEEFLGLAIGATNETIAGPDSIADQDDVLLSEANA